MDVPRSTDTRVRAACGGTLRSVEGGAVEQLDRPVHERVGSVRPGAADEAAARRALRTQIDRLERQLSGTVVASFPAGGLATAVPAAGGPRVLSFGELERIRDALAGSVAQARGTLAEREARREAARAQLERMLLAPGSHRFVRVTQQELGEGGCGAWHVKPRLGIIGMLMGWWHVKLSSGCPLAT